MGLQNAVVKDHIDEIIFVANQNTLTLLLGLKTKSISKFDDEK